MQAPSSIVDFDTRRHRAIYRSEHRGTKELDLLFGQFCHALLDNKIGGQTRDLNDEERLTVLEWLIEQPDYLLQPWLVDAKTIPLDVPAIVGVALRAYTFQV